ncbi:RNA methyltransferase [Lentilitoribacter sp. Alg239-R112]|uniref:TrmH family RNA methyltransferase n=1 Tax=Lentilitoribacter sp. Alg239-R112 TaxID=2305987 RepID=UPI0013A6D9D3|nr:RNA methyltransferase [Lentilitoribacter sp. Alg239-R112]
MSAKTNDLKKRRVGTVKEVTSLANPIVKDIKSLAQKKNRDGSNRFIAEGLKLIVDAIDLGWDIETLIYAKSVADKPLIQKKAAQVVANSGLVLEVSEKVLTSITRKDNPQMVVGVFSQKFTPIEDIKPQPDETYIALDRVRDPGNLGTIIRTADAAGISGIILVGATTDPFSIEAVRATMGSVFSLPISRVSIDEFISWKDRHDISIIGSHLKGSKDYRAIDYKTKPCILLMGNEQAGLPEELSSTCDALARIPQVGDADSLNLAIATGLMIYEARRHLLELDLLEPVK